MYVSNVIENLSQTQLITPGKVTWVNIIPDYLRLDDNGGWHLDKQCQSATMYFDPNQEDNYEENFQSVTIDACKDKLILYKNNPANKNKDNICLKYQANDSNGQSNCYLYKDCIKEMVTDTGYVCYNQNDWTKEGQLVPTFNEISGEFEAEIEQGHCFTMDEYKLVDYSGLEAITYDLPDSDPHLIFIQDLVSNKIHVCPKNVTNFGLTTFTINAYVANTQISASKTYRIIPKNNSGLDGHYRKGTRHESTDCMNDGYASHNFENNSGPFTEESCLNECLDINENPDINIYDNQAHLNSAIYCCTYNNFNQICKLKVSGTMRSRLGNHVVNDADYVSYINIIPNNIDPSIHRVGWYQDAYCTGGTLIEENTELTNQNFEYCWRRYQELVIQASKTGCAQLGGQKCRIMENCSTDIVVLESYYCYNPGYVEPSFNPTIPLPNTPEPEVIPVIPEPDEIEESPNQAPSFTEPVDSEVIFNELLPNNEGVNFTLPEIQDENGAETVSVQVQGLDQTFSSFDIDNRQFDFFNLTESKILSVNITLTDLEGASSLTKINFIFEIQAVIEPVSNKTINQAPVFITEIPEEIIFGDLFPGNEGVIFQLPEIYDQGGTQNVTINVEGLGETKSSFDQELRQIRFFNLSESRNETLNIILTDSEGASGTYEIKFAFQINEVITQEKMKPSNFTAFEGVIIPIDDGTEEVLEVLEKKKEVVKNLTTTKVKSDGNVKLMFEESLKVPAQVQNLINKEGDKRHLVLKVDSKDGCDEPKQQDPLDLYLQQALEITVLKFEEGSKQHVPNRIQFQPTFIKWTESELQFKLRFSQPLQVSQGPQKDKVIIKVLNENDFISKESNLVVYKRNQTMPQEIEIPKQLLFGMSEEALVEQFDKVKSVGFGIAVIQTVVQSIFKGNKKKTLLLYMNLQLLSLISVLNVMMPAQADLILGEIIKLVGFKQVEPSSIFVMLKSFAVRRKSNKSFADTYEVVLLEFENSDHFLKTYKFSTTILLVGGVLFALGLSLLTCKKTRELIKPIIKDFMKDLFWNGTIFFFEVSYLSFLIKAKDLIQDSDHHSFSVWFQLIVQSVVIISFPTLVAIVLAKKDNEELKSKASIAKIGHLTDDIMLKKGQWAQKMHFPISLLMKAAIVWISFVSSERQTLMLGVLYFLFLGEFAFVLQIKPYDLDSHERRLRNVARYFISLSFMHSFLLIGRYMDEDLDPKDLKPSCDGSEPIARSVFIGFLPDEKVHFYLGYSQIILFCCSAVPGILILFYTCLRYKTMRQVTEKLKHFRRKYCLKNQAYDEQLEAKSNDMFLMISQRIQNKQLEFSQCKMFAKQVVNAKLEQPLEDVGIPINQFFENQYQFNHKRLFQVKYAQLKIVVESGPMNMEVEELEGLKQRYYSDMVDLMKKQRHLKDFKVGDYGVDYELKFERDFIMVNKYEALDIMKKERAEVEQLFNIKWKDRVPKVQFQIDSQSSFESSSISVNESLQDSSSKCLKSDPKTSKEKKKIELCDNEFQLEESKELQIAKSSSTKKLIEVKTKSSFLPKKAILPQIKETSDSRINDIEFSFRHHQNKKEDQISDQPSDTIESKLDPIIKQSKTIYVNLYDFQNCKSDVTPEQLQKYRPPKEKLEKFQELCRRGLQQIEDRRASPRVFRPRDYKFIRE